MPKEIEVLSNTVRSSHDAIVKFSRDSIKAVMGDKGGVGKSAFAKALMDGLDEAGVPFEILDCDKGIQDAAKHVGEEEALQLNTPKGFRDLYAALKEAKKGVPVIISTPGGLVERALEHSPHFLDVLPQLSKELGRPFRVAWVIDDKRDGLEKLKEFREVTKFSPIDVVMNEWFCPTVDFAFFEKSNERKINLANGGQILRLPKLERAVMAKLTIDHMPLRRAFAELGLFDKAGLIRWWNETAAELRKTGYIP